MSKALANTLLSAAQEALSDEFIISLMQQRTKFENWLQVELAKRLRSSDEVATVELECTIENGQAMDLKCQLTDRSCVGIEIKLYVCGKAVSDTRQSITNDIQKLQKQLHGGYMLIVVYGYKSQKDLSVALYSVDDLLKGFYTEVALNDQVGLCIAKITGQQHT